jgi:hypothetical protein
MGKWLAWVVRLGGMLHTWAGPLFAWACLTGPKWPRPLLPTLLAAGVVLPGVFWLDRDVFRFDRPFDPNPNSAISIEMAVNRILLGSPSACTWAPPDGKGIRDLLNQPEVLSQVVLDLPAQVTPSPQEYARSTSTFLINEPGLLLVDDAILRLVSGLTVHGLIRAHAVLQAACLALLALLLLRVGFSPLLAGAALHLGLLVLARVNEEFPVGQYPLMVAVLLALLAVFGLALSLGAHRRAWATAPALVAAGLVSGLLCSLRTSYAPAALALLALYLLLSVLDLVPRRALSAWRALALTGLALACFVAGYRLFGAACLDPIRREAEEANCSNYVHHAIGHPLVLSLALTPEPHDALAQREGIAWDDKVGVSLAHRIDPQVDFLDAHYDVAMLTYYAKLWFYYPEEMRDLYAAKLDIAGVDCIPYLQALAGGVEGAPGGEGFLGLKALARRLSWPLNLLPKGSQWLLAFAGLVGLAVLLARWTGPGPAFALGGLGALGCLQILEAAAIDPYFSLNYHTPLLLLTLFAGVVPYQLGLDALAWVLRADGRLARLRFAHAAPGQEEESRLPPLPARPDAAPLAQTTRAAPLASMCPQPLRLARSGPSAYNPPPHVSPGTGGDRTRCARQTSKRQRRPSSAGSSPAWSPPAAATRGPP